MSSAAQKPVRFRAIATYLEEGIATGRFDPQRRLPSDMELARKFGTSRPTVVRAMLDLQHRGLIERRAGSGTYIKHQDPGQATAAGVTLGILAAGLDDTEILDPICDELCRQAERHGYLVLRGETRAAGAAETDDPAAEAERLAERFVARGVRGVFFAPLERVSDRAAVNARIARTLTAAGVALVLLDRDIEEFPARSRFDLVGLDNFTAGFELGRHLAGAGYRQIRFVARPRFPSTTDLRMAGLREALIQAGLSVARHWAWFGEPDDPAFVGQFMRGGRPDALVCSNDRTAAMLMQTLTAQGVRLPADLAIAGFDDVRYATLLAVPLTTMRQPCRDIGLVAVELMADRLAGRRMPARSILLPATLIARGSTKRAGAVG